MARKRVFGIHHSDAREIKRIVGRSTKVNVTITSPPYFDLKDYGYKEQIGFGQSYEDYLEDLANVFKEVYDVTTENGTLWVIIDAFRKDGEVIPLPFDLAYHLRKVGWKLQEIVIWEKDRTVPWTHHGQMRNIFEYILVFSKSSDYVFNIDRIRDNKNLKKWWIRYPERYNPKGKTPVAIWQYNIPVQGSWGGNYIRHFCPLPEDLIARILLLTTDEGDVVLDPFSGTGTVLSMAESMSRKYIGTELNEEYISKFSTYLEETRKDKRQKYLQRKREDFSEDEFESLIWNLRALKFGKHILNLVIKQFPKVVLSIFVSAKIETIENGRRKVDFYLLSAMSKKNVEIKHFVDQSCAVPPLSKFGIDYHFHIVGINDYVDVLNHHKAKLYSYNRKFTHKYLKKIDVGMINGSNIPSILSDICVNIDESKYL